MAEATIQEPRLVRRGERFRMQELGLLVVIVLLAGMLAVAGYYNAGGRYANAFFNFDNLFNGIATPMSIFAIMAIGLTLVIITGGIDISVGSTFAVAALATAWSLQGMDLHASVWIVLPVAILVPIVVGTLCGLVNGLLIVGLRMHPFIVTLGTMSIFRGLANVLPAEKTLPVGGRDLPLAFTEHFMQWDFGVDLRIMPMLLMLACGLAGWVYLSFLVAGRETYAIGGNEEAARFSGLRVGLIKMRVYAIAGLLAGVAGMVSVGRFGTASSDTGTGYELTVIAAAVVGGASLTGGRGTALGAILGALIIRLIENGITILRLNTEFSTIIVGAAIIIAVAIDRISEFARVRRVSAGRPG